MWAWGENRSCLDAHECCGYCVVMYVDFDPIIAPPPILFLLSGLTRGIALVIAGCSSNSPLLPDIYVLNLLLKDAGQNSSNTSLEFKVGYFGYCILLSDNSQACGRNPSLNAQGLNLSDPFNLLDYARDVKDHVLFPHLM